MRLFVAAFPPREVRNALASAARTLEVSREIRFTRPDNIHLTLKFLGDVPEDETDALRAALARIAPTHAPFDLSPTGFGGFPSNDKARVLWAGTTGEVERLRDLAGDVEEALTSLGFAAERRGFSPHLTLARAKKPVSLSSPPQRRIERNPPIPGFCVEEISLVESRTEREGAIYTPLEVYSLRGESAAS